MKLAFIGMNDLAGLEADARFAAEEGFTGLEFNYWGGFKDLTADTVTAMRTILDRYGVKCSALGPVGLEPHLPRCRRATGEPGALGAGHSLCRNVGR